VISFQNFKTEKRKVNTFFQKPRFFLG